MQSFFQTKISNLFVWILCKNQWILYDSIFIYFYSTILYYTINMNFFESELLPQTVIIFYMIVSVMWNS